MSDIKETNHFKAFRDDQAHAFSSMAGGMLYLPLSFKRTEQKIDVDGERRTVMKPTEKSFRLIGNLYTRAQTYFSNAGDVFRSLYSAAPAIYTALPFPAIHFVKDYLGSEENFAIQDIGAEFLDGKGIAEPLHTLFMYRIVDGNYNVHYAMSTSMAMLEAKSNELHNASEIAYNDDPMFGETAFLVNGDNLRQFMFALMQDYFGVDTSSVRIIGSSGVLSLEPDTPDFEVIGAVRAEDLRDTGKNSRIGMVISTDEEFSVF